LYIKFCSPSNYTTVAWGLSWESKASSSVWWLWLQRVWQILFRHIISLKFFWLYKIVVCRYVYDWKRDEAEKNLLRTHTTAVSTRMLYKLAQEVIQSMLFTVLGTLVILVCPTYWQWHYIFFISYWMVHDIYLFIMVAIDQKPFAPKRYYSIDRVFRNEAVDRTHLAEFHQIEGSFLFPCL